MISLWKNKLIVQKFLVYRDFISVKKESFKQMHQGTRVTKIENFLNQNNKLAKSETWQIDKLKFGQIGNLSNYKLSKQQICQITNLQIINSPNWQNAKLEACQITNLPNWKFA